MSYNDRRPAFFSERSYFDSAEAVWIDPEAEEIPFGAEAVTISYEGIFEEIEERAERDAAKRRRPLTISEALAATGVPGDAPLSLEVVTVEDFVAVEEAGAAALVGDEDDGAVLAEGGDVMFYGDGGAGKTTLAIDLACHLAAGDNWLGIRVGRPVRVLLIENEGPRPLFRAKLRRKLEGWKGSPIGEGLTVLEQPWARLSFAEEGWRDALADVVRSAEIDVVIIGPVSRSGMNEAGTLQQVRDFTELVSEVRDLSGRRLVVVLIHHENKGGQVSGAWEGAGDTLFHVQAQGPGSVRLHFQKVRWSSAWHKKTLQLAWADGEGFEVEDKPELDDETIAAQLLSAIRHEPGTAWGKVEKATPGVNRERRMAVRDLLFGKGEIVNIAKGEGGQETALAYCPERKTARLYPSDDPTISHLLPARGADGEQIAPTTSERGNLHLLPAPGPIGEQGVGAADSSSGGDELPF